MKRIAILVSMLAMAVAGTFAVSIGSSTASAADDPPAALQTFFDAVNAGDGDAMAASFTDSGYFEQVDSTTGSFGAFGTAALQFAFTDIDQEGIHVTLTSSSVSGTTVTGVGSLTDNTSRAAGVDRYIQPFVATVDGSKLASFVVRYDETDAQTAAYLEYQAAHDEQGAGDNPADLVELTMSGNQTGVGGAGTVAPGVVLVFAETTGAPEGVEQPTAIYSGTCDHLGSVVKQLAPALGGSSGNLISMSLDELLASPHAITVAAAENSSVIVSCANIVKSAGTTGLPNTGTGGSTGTDLSWLIAVLALSGIAFAGAGAFAARRR